MADRKLPHENQQIHSNQKIIYERNRKSWLIVTKRNHLICNRKFLICNLLLIITAPPRVVINYQLQITRLQMLMNGVVVIDKPGGLTSHDVVNRVRRILGQRSVGHLGTLDPSATGVLPIVLGNLTRLAQFYVHSEKTYEGVIRFGFATDTYDAGGEPSAPLQDVHLNREEVRALAAQFQGTIEQMPPPFSAKKIAGVPAYKLARKKQEVALKPVQVEIKEFEILDTNANQAAFRARVASGTYIRSVAHEMGQKLGCGAHLALLRRTAVAEFAIVEAHSLPAREAAMQQGSAE